MLKKIRSFAILWIYLAWLYGCSSASFRFTEHPSWVQVPAAHNVYLLLPLGGEHNSSATAIRNGFLAAYYYAHAGSSNPAQISVVNTYGHHIDALYSEAVQKGADFVVGPLLKDNIARLVKQGNVPVPTLVLGSTASYHSTDYLYQLSLHQVDEARQVAKRAKADGFKNALIIVPPGTWGAGIAQAFQRAWESAGGHTVGVWAYPKSGSMALMVQHALKSRQGRPDVVLLAARPNYARRINAFLKFDTQDALPVYATSLVYTGIPSSKDHDLDGVIFADMPWVLTQQPANLEQLSRNISDPANVYQWMRLYALGMDAYHLTYAFDQLAYGLKGDTGVLTLGHNGRITRTLSWAKFENGVPRPLPQ